MKKIPERYERGGFQYDVVSREGDSAIYKQTDKILGLVVGYEVVVIKRYKEGQKVFGMDVSGHEYLPPQSKWGKDGFSTYTLEKAIRLMIELAIRERKKNE